MDALLPAFIAALLAEIGDKTQWLVLLLAARFGRSGAVLAGVALAAAGNAALASYAGMLLATLINFRALTLLLGLALLFAGVGALLPQRRPTLSVPGWMGPALASGFAFFVLEFGDKTQFLTSVLSARAHAPVLTATGAALGVIAASAATLALGQGHARLRSERLRRIVGALFLLLALWAAAHALRII